MRRVEKLQLMNISKHLEIKDNPFIQENLSAIKRDKNVVIAIIGEVGNGKTISASSIAYGLDPTFNVDRVVTNVHDFMKLINSGLPKGSVILFDEFSKAVSKLNFQSPENKEFINVMTTWREMNCILIITMPTFELAEGKTTIFVNHTLVAKETNKLRRLVRVAWYDSQYNPIREKEYTKAPIRHVRVEGNQLRRLPIMLIGFPPRKLADAIRDKVNNYKGNVRQEGEKIVKESQERKERERKRFNELDAEPKHQKAIRELLPELAQYIKRVNGKYIVDRNLIKLKYNYPERTIDLIRTALQQSPEFNRIITIPTPPHTHNKEV